MVEKPHFITDKLKKKIGEARDIGELFERGKTLLKTPAAADLPDFRFRKFRHSDGTSLVIVEQRFGWVLMESDELWDTDAGETLVYL